METKTKIDESKVEEFGEQLLDALNGGALSIMISIGHRTGLFDTMARMPSGTSEEIAAAANLDERYVREWLGAMVTGRVVDVDPASGVYRLPPEHAACLTRDAAPNNIAAFAQYIPLLGCVEDGIIGCFNEGGGLPYDAFPRFHEVMAEDSGQTVLPALNDHILPLAPGLKQAMAEGIEVLDIGCGSGRAVNQMSRAYPASRFTGYDFSEEAIGVATAEANGSGNVRFEARDVTALGETGRFDLITAFDAIHDQVDPAAVLRGIHDALKDDGVFLMQDIHSSCDVEKNIDHPAGTLLYTISTMHCMTVSLAGGGAGLGTMWGEETALRMLAEAGFGNVTKHRLDHDFQNTYFVARKR
ncbi:MAG: class I SAM-dependent methyltransferase [Planctomycetota bacterium]